MVSSRFSYVPVNESNVKKYGQPTAVYQQLLHGVGNILKEHLLIDFIVDLLLKEVDLVPFYFVLSQEKNMKMDFLDALINAVVLLVLHPDIDTSDDQLILKVTKPFRWTVQSIHLIFTFSDHQRMAFAD